ncbi:MAG: TonB family protein [Opitutaceae bacterium]|nr:TonB family protein [Opitutaceae bacterium]
MAPTYPALAVKEPIAGTAVVVFTVDVDGKVSRPRVKSADDKAFGKAVFAVLPDWEFEPATVDGEPVAKKVSIPFQFKPNGKDMLNRGVGRMVFRPIDGEVIPLRELGQRPTPKGRPGVSYPKAKQGSGEEQRVRVKFIIGRDGKTYNPEVLDEVDKVWHLAALATVARREFEPIKKKGKAQQVEVAFPIFFTEQPQQRGGGRGGRGGGGGGGGRG